jgi:CRISPR-associated protein Cas1
MGYKQIYIRKSHKLSLKNNSLCILKNANDVEEIFIPLEDISTILIENPFTVITARLLTECSKYGITTYLCNEEYLPNTQILPLNEYYNQLAVYNMQISINKNLKTKIWQKIVKSKIKNQKIVLSFTSNIEDAIKMLEEYEKKVKLNDIDNREGIASKVYFQSIFGQEFIRFAVNNVSNALNYGYTILNNSIVRTLILHGFNTYIGIWHQSDKNAFNLASDFIEPFRPIVDYFCYWNENFLDFPLSPSNKKKLISLLNTKISINNKICSIDYAIDEVIKSFLKVLETNEIEQLLLPEIIGVNFIDEEYI